MEIPEKVLGPLTEAIIDKAILPISVSNTGHTVCIGFPKTKKLSFERVHVQYDATKRLLILTPSTDGRKISDGFVTFKSDVQPNWPHHGRLTLDFQRYQGKDANELPYYGAKLPDSLPPPVRQSRGLVKQQDKQDQSAAKLDLEARRARSLNETISRAAKVHQARNVSISVLGTTQYLKVPEEELLPILLDWTKKGYLQ